MKAYSLAAIALLLLAGAPRLFAGSDEAGQNEGANGGTFYAPLPEKVQEDIGDIRPAAEATLASHFHFQATLNGQYVSNAPLYHSHDRSDFLIVPTVEGSFSMALNKNFAIDLNARIEDFSYVSHQDLGFWGFSGNEELEYRYKPAWPRIFIGAEPYYYFSYANGNRLTAAIAPIGGVDESYSINRGKTLLFAQYYFGNYFSSPNIDTRDSHTVTLSLTQQLQRSLYAQLYWQLEYSDYYVFGRDELRDVVGVSFIHQFNPRTFASIFVNYVDNASNNSYAKYTEVNSGFSLVLQY